MVDRPIVYPGEILSDSVLLGGWKNSLYGIGFLAQAVLGTSTLVGGLGISPTGPASLNVIINQGSIYTFAAVDATAYGSLGTDGNFAIKQGLLKSAATLTITPPTTSGFSQVFLVQAIYADVDGGATVLPYFNSANPALPLSGPGNSGATQNTVRAGVCTVSLKAGTAATTGTQTAPSPDAGFVPLYLITVANGATAITSANIATSPTAPFIPFTLSQIAAAIQQQSGNYAVDTGSANALAIALPSGTTLTAGMPVRIKKSGAANTGAITISINGGSAISTVWDDGAAFGSADWPANAVGEGIYDGTVIRMNGPLGPTIFLRASSSGSGAALITVGTTAISGGTAHGVLLNSGGNLGNSAAGTAKQVLTSNGASADPTFQAIPSPIAPQAFVLTTASSSPFATPTVGGVLPLYLKVRMVGGGSGGGGSGSGGGVGTAGGATTFGALTAGGAPATPVNTTSTYPTAAAATGGYLNLPGGLGAGTFTLNSGVGQVPYGASSELGNGGNPDTTVTAGFGGAAATSGTGFGSGGGAGGVVNTVTTYQSGWGGNSGAYCKGTIATPGASITFAVGAAGSGGAAGTGGGPGGGGAPGVIIVEAHWQ